MQAYLREPERLRLIRLNLDGLPADLLRERCLGADRLLDLDRFLLLLLLL